RGGSGACPARAGGGSDGGAGHAHEVGPNCGRSLPASHLRARRGARRRLRHHGLRTAGEGEKGLPPPATEEAAMSKQKFPPGWDEDRVRDVLAHYENQTEDEQFAEIEAALEAEDITLMAVPTELVPEVRALLARKQSA